MLQFLDTFVYKINKPVNVQYFRILTPQSLDFITSLHRQFNNCRLELLEQRKKQKEKFNIGLEHEENYSEIRNRHWTARPLRKDLHDQRVELIGSVDRRTLIKGLNSGAKVYVANFDNYPASTWEQLLQGQLNLRDAICREIDFTSANGTAFKLKEKTAVIKVRPRGLELDELNIAIEEQPVSAAFFDFGLYFFTNAEKLISNGTSPYFFLPNVANKGEALLWNRIFEYSESELDIPAGTIKATVQIDSASGAAQMDEIIYELRERIAALTLGSYQNIFKTTSEKDSPPILAISNLHQLLIKTCHRRNIHAIACREFIIGISSQEEVDSHKLTKVLKDKESEAELGFDGTIVTHPKLVAVAEAGYNRYLKSLPNQKNKKMNNFNITPADVLNPKRVNVLSRLTNLKHIWYNLPKTALIGHALRNKEGRLTDKGALAVTTGKFTGRCPDDKYIVLDRKTEHAVNWGKINHPFSPENFNSLYERMNAFVENQPMYVVHACAGASRNYGLKLEIATTKAWQSLFSQNIFLTPSHEELTGFSAEWGILCIPEFEADPTMEGTRSPNFTIINFTKKLILIGGTEYAGEIKKSVFTVLNFLLPLEHGVLPMHCSATVGKEGDVALFFGLSGTGKTTLSADLTRTLIGDDEHGWGDDLIFNFEGGCYAKVNNLEPIKEPRIFGAIKAGAVLENVCFVPGTPIVNYKDTSITENSRAAYPLSYADPNGKPLINSSPKNIFFLTADATGLLPPLANLNIEQAKAFFLTGYTSKLAGTEMGIITPQPTFSACFGAAFLPLHPMEYADLLIEKVKASGAKVWLVNTGWTGGAYGTGHRIPLHITRALIDTVLTNAIDTNTWEAHPVFGIKVPECFPGIDKTLFDTKTGWNDEKIYKVQAEQLLDEFVKNLAIYVGADKAYDLFHPTDSKACADRPNVF